MIGFIITAALSLGVAYMAHSIDINRLEAKHKEELSAQVRFDVQQCNDSKQPAKEANEYGEKNNNKLLADCLVQLRHPVRQLHISRTPRGLAAADRQPAGGITTADIAANNIECRKDRNDLNTAKIWGQGYQKFTKPN